MLDQFKHQVLIFVPFAMPSSGVVCKALSGFINSVFQTRGYRSSKIVLSSDRCSSKTILFSVRYSGSKGDSEEKAEVAAGSSHTFPEKVEDMGTWQAVQRITNIR
jgi:hypothetical protein